MNIYHFYTGPQIDEYFGKIRSLCMKNDMSHSNDYIHVDFPR